LPMISVAMPVEHRERIEGIDDLSRCTATVVVFGGAVELKYQVA